MRNRQTARKQRVVIFRVWVSLAVCVFPRLVSSYRLSDSVLVLRHKRSHRPKALPTFDHLVSPRPLGLANTPRSNAYIDLHLTVCHRMSDIPNKSEQVGETNMSKSENDNEQVSSLFFLGPFLYLYRMYAMAIDCPRLTARKSPLI